MVKFKYLLFIVMYISQFISVDDLCDFLVSIEQLNIFAMVVYSLKLYIEILYSLFSLGILNIKNHHNK